VLSSDRKKILDHKLRYLEERTKKYIQMMELTYNSFASSSVLSPEGLQKKNIISVALKATNNVILLAQNLLRRHPDFDRAFINGITLSFHVQKDASTSKNGKEERDRKDGHKEKRKRYKEAEDDPKGEAHKTPAKREKKEEAPKRVPVVPSQDVLLPPASPVSPQGSPVVISIEDLPQVWKGNLGKADVAICRISAKQIEGPPLSDDVMQLLKGSSILAVKDRTPIGDLTQYLNQGKLPRVSVFYFQPENDTDGRPFIDFIHYLKSKDRAGIVRLSQHKIMYMVPSSPLASLLLTLTTHGAGSGLVKKDDVLLGVIESDVDKSAQSVINTANMNPLAFPMMQFPNMLNMPNFAIPNMGMMNMANLQAMPPTPEVPGMTSPKALPNVQGIPNFPNMPAFANVSNFAGMMPMNMYTYMQNLAAMQQLAQSQPDAQKSKSP
jgi:hypothetical protein